MELNEKSMKSRLKKCRMLKIFFKQYKSEKKSFKELQEYLLNAVCCF